MKQDYILIAVDPKSQFAIRFACLKNIVDESVTLHKVSKDLRQTYADFLLASTIVGSRLDEQENSLFQLKFENYPIAINCEVSPKGLVRSAIFPPENKDQFGLNAKGQMHVNKLKQDNQMYQSIVEYKIDSVVDTFRDYLDNSEQSDSVFLIHSNEKDGDKNYGLWINKLPSTNKKDWQEFIKRFESANYFTDSFKNTNDPDEIVQTLFPEGIQILAVTKPKLYCTCSKDRILKALASLPTEDLVEIYMDKKGVETQCDYCHKHWSIPDEDIKTLIPTLSQTN